MKAVIFDFGGVFIDSPFELMNDLAARHGMQREELLADVFGDYASDTDHPWHRLERGEISLGEAREQIMAGSSFPDGEPLDPFAMFASLGSGSGSDGAGSDDSGSDDGAGSDDSGSEDGSGSGDDDSAGGGVRDEMVDFARSLRGRGLGTGLLTNNAKEFAQFWRPLVPLDELFDDVVDSSEVGMRKPDAAIYRLALERLGVESAETVFIDDAPGNVAGAEAVGIASVLIGPKRTDVPAAIAAVEALLG
ncbi:MAG: HAD family hydrolase [Microthrixaceae bacterium]